MGGGRCNSECQLIWMYQENATLSNCGGVWSPSQPCANTFDANWQTYGTARNRQEASLSLTYEIPENAVRAKWEVKWEDNGEETGVDLPMPQECFGNLLRLTVESDGNLGESRFYCSAGQAGNIFIQSFDSGSVYEEAVWWFSGCLGDFDGNGDVGAADLAFMLGNWGACEYYCEADLNGDGGGWGIRFGYVVGELGCL